MKIALAMAAGLVLATSAAAQNPFEQLIQIEGGRVIFDGAAVRSSGSTSASAGAADAAPAPETPRQQRLKTLVFDRRPSSILAAWSTPPEPTDAELADAELADAEPADAPQAPAGAAEAPATDESAAAQAPAAPAASDGVVGAVVDAEEAARAAERSAAEVAAAAEAEQAAAQAEAAAAAAAAAAVKAQAEAAALEAELTRFTRMVTLGDWAGVRAYLAGLTEAEAKAGYEQLVTSLIAGPPKPPSRFANWAETNYYGPGDITGLAGAASYELSVETLAKLGQLLRQSVDGGSLVEQCVERFRHALDDGSLAIERSEVAQILFGAVLPLEAGEFLPAPDEAKSANDRAALNLLARHFVALHADENDVRHLEQAWDVTQAVLATGDVEGDVEKEALARAVMLAPRIRDELGQSWLDASFTERPERGMQILAVIGAGASKGQVEHAQDAERRLNGLELQTTAAEAVLAAAPERAADWSATLNLLATNWLREALYSYQWDQSTARGPQLQRDFYGNFFYYSSRSSTNNNMPAPLKTDELLDIRPSDRWLERVDAALQPKFAMVVAQLLLKVNEESEAFPYIERIAASHPERGEELVAEFLRVWTRNHDPNAANSNTSSYMFMYGFEERKNAIPLTRSKQERNLAELSEWVARLRELPIEIDDDLVANAFTAAHSTAEVYRIDTIERVFGQLDDLEPRTLAALVQRMRSNLVGVWREPNTQKQSNTKRRQKDIQAEIVRGYEVARTVVDRALLDHPDEWSLVLARASVAHDENNYRQEIEKTTEFASRREEAFADFAVAADLYAQAVPELDLEDETTQVYETWFYAALGACDLDAIDERKQVVTAQLDVIRDAIGSLPGEAAERHTGMFANTIYTRMSNVNPAVKFRYVRSGLAIAGEHERSDLAREVLEYYGDLVTEIKLETTVDGATRVGHEEPFGMFVDIRHTREIEREAGGFSKYLINQNNQQFAWNYGRPTENYRDKFEEAAREALSEHFVVHSVTFNHPDTNSRAIEQYGWRVTPYAYLLLQARGPEVDRVPPLRLDLDFLDTTGYVVLPVESSPLVVDATVPSDDVRPFADLEITQTLDERQAGDGKLLLEIKAKALGLVPSLDEVVELAPAHFDVVTTDDQGVSVTKFDEESDETAVVSERTWMVSMRAKEDLEELPESFEFAEPRVADAEVLYQRYVDADLESVERAIALEKRYGERGAGAALAWLGGALALALIGGGAFWFLRRRDTVLVPQARYRLPERVSPFTVIGLLRHIESTNGIGASERDELQRHIEELEQHYFGDEGNTPPDLERIARRWVDRVS